MKSVKTLNLVSVGAILFAREAGRLQEFADKVTPFIDSPLDGISQEIIQSLEGNALHKALDEIFTDLHNFLRNLYRATPIVTKPREGENVARKAHNDNGAPKHAAPSSKGDRMKKPRRTGTPVDGFVPQPERRNRKGQRARRAEYERLYGSQARHLQGRVSSERPPKEKIERGDRHFDEARKIHPRDVDMGNDKPLHPSWEAKRRQAQAMKVAAQGAPLHKKIKFTDEDNDE